MAITFAMQKNQKGSAHKIYVLYRIIKVFISILLNIEQYLWGNALFIKPL